MAKSCSCLQRQCILCETLSTAQDECTEQQFCEIEGSISKDVYRANEWLFQQGMPARDLFILKYGHVKLSSSLPDGRCHGLRLAGPWSVLGIEALGMESYPFSAVALTDVQVCTFRHRDMLAALENNPKTSLKLVTMLNAELRRSMEQLRNIGVLHASERVAWFLLSTAVDNTCPPVSRSDMAEILGLTMETVSRVLSRLRQCGLVDAPSNRRSVRILDPERLEALCGDTRQAQLPLNCA
ncbi:Crp/Fnr family transcriptional regulator [Thiohalomonas denitrificans]|uniref:Crp/Fnr family transcriptional regulator n=1 Tax=Thiohalomonas denitrificans TaxID=415747 RepID=UPI0026EE9AA1|nr:Crp/Fnr family transcriptional regulator [Thiohalomonas denitrificans]